MRIVHSIDIDEPETDVILTIGTFDGVHRGHQHLLEQLVSHARRTRQLSAVLTFYPHPRTLLHPEFRPTCLSTPEERAAIMESLSLDLLVLLPFTRALADTPSDIFVRTLYDRLRMRELWVGSDFAMGRNREGTIATLQSLARQLGYVLHTVDPLYDGEQPISSTRIRALLSEARVAEAARLLGRNYAVSGAVVTGEQRGRSMGIRTANLRTPAERAMPSDGVYAVWATVDGRRLPGVANVGVRPSFGPGDRLLEVHLLDYAGNLYGKTLVIEFVRHLRSERRFEDPTALVEQIHRDIVDARTLLSAGLPRE